MKAQSLSQRLNLAIVGITLATLILSLVFVFAAYGLLFQFAPKLISAENALFPAPVEWAIYSVCVVLGSIAASVVATRVARRMVEPLETLAEAARAIADGNLSARATLVAPAPTEASQMIADFNAMADRLEKAVDDIVTWNSLIAHELRTPVTILKGRLQGIAEGVFQPDPALLQSLHQQADGLARLVEDLRVVSLLDSGRLQLRPVEIDLASEIEGLARLIERDLDKAGFGLRMTLTSGRCVADPVRLRQAVLALVDNTLKYAEPCVLEIAARVSDAEVVISVIDQGPGMPEGFTKRAFEPFRRAEDVDGKSGSGLGLAVVRGIAEAHGGEVTYERRDGLSAFTIVMPRMNRSGLGAE
ncbi:sensor histidine kinase [Caulobacter sp. RL271]|jgi:two-component system sensor histidine kinase AdeS|uniref:histidine kinase n=1 Tax=Caulobacter segnis TaxID=88688 RepID=A0ABY5A0W9_9CAUL|nr:HAMP domain-containing sensor histidine kinase [Caulobacter segnis]USQ98084.1 ATP-binding protein [Caulobacter segnis]